MAIYSKDAFVKANGSLALLESDISDANDIINKFKSFKSDSSNNLKGEVWDLARESLDYYIAALEARKNSAKLFADTIRSVNDSMIAAMGDFSDLDTSLLDEQRSIYSKCDQIINGDASKFSEKDRQLFNSSLMNSTKKLINQIEKVNEAEKTCLAKLDSLTSTSADYYNKVGAIISSSSLYLTEI